MLVWFEGDETLPLIYHKDNKYTCVNFNYASPHYGKTYGIHPNWKNITTKIGPKEISRWED